MRNSAVADAVPIPVGEDRPGGASAPTQPVARRALSGRRMPVLPRMAG